jgi:hypothetical protein
MSGAPFDDSGAVALAARAATSGASPHIASGRAFGATRWLMRATQPITPHLNLL